MSNSAVEDRVPAAGVALQVLSDFNVGASLSPVCAPCLQPSPRRCGREGPGTRVCYETIQLSALETPEWAVQVLLSVVEVEHDIYELFAATANPL